MYLLGVIVFTAASLGCGLASSSLALIVFRFVQGAGAAVMVPQIMSVIQTQFNGTARATALSAYGVVLASGGGRRPHPRWCPGECEPAGRDLATSLSRQRSFGNPCRAASAQACAGGQAARHPAARLRWSRNRCAGRLPVRASSNTRPRTRLAVVDLRVYRRERGPGRGVRSGRTANCGSRWRPFAESGRAARTWYCIRARDAVVHANELRRIPVRFYLAPAGRSRLQRTARRPHLRPNGGGVRPRRYLLAQAAGSDASRTHANRARTVCGGLSRDRGNRAKRRG